MSVSFILRTVRQEGTAALSARIQVRKLGVNLLVRTPLMVDIAKYSARKGGRLNEAWLSSPEGVRVERLKLEIRDAINSLTDAGTAVSSDTVSRIIGDIYYRDVRAAESERMSAIERAQKEASRITLREFIDRFRAEIRTGDRLNDRGTLYSQGTISAINQTCECLRRFEACKKHVYDFDEIDLKFYNEYMAWLMKRNYAVNTTGKCIKVLKQIMSLAESEGYHSNPRYKDKRFKVARVDVDSIYLTKDDLAAMMAVDLSGKPDKYDLARDIFMIGVWTAQRVSDYNNIKPGDIHTKMKRWIEDIPNPDRPGDTMAEIRTRKIMYIDICQQKTGANVSIPCSSELKRILEKYGFNIPHIKDQCLNECIKEIGRWAGLTETVPIVTTKGGKSETREIPKYDLIRSHTARRTGATLMYLFGMDIYDIMKITGHSSPTMLRKYIKADQLEIVEKITDKYDYFD